MNTATDQLTEQSKTQASTAAGNDQAKIMLEIVAQEMITPVGHNAEMTAAAVRAGITAYDLGPVMNKRFSPMTLALVPDDVLPPLEDGLARQGLTSRQQRLLRLCTLPLQNLAEHLTQPLPLLLCGPEKRPDRRSVISDKTLEQLTQQTGVAFDSDNSYVVPHGRAAGFYAIKTAMTLIASGQHEQVIIGGVDSFLDLYLLATLDAEDRVLAEGIMDGFAPGEAAAFVIVKKASAGGKVRIAPPGVAEEDGHLYGDAPNKGEGLARAISEAFSVAQNSNVKTVMASFNGESYSTKEWGVSSIRNSANLDPDFVMHHPAEYFGDVGGAYLPVALALANAGVSKGYYSKPMLVWGSSEYSQRGAVLLG